MYFCRLFIFNRLRKILVSYFTNLTDIRGTSLFGQGVRYHKSDPDFLG